MAIPFRVTIINLVAATLLVGCGQDKVVVVATEGGPAEAIRTSDTPASRSLGKAIDDYAQHPDDAGIERVNAAIAELDAEIAQLVASPAPDGSPEKLKAQQTLADLRSIRQIEEQRFSRLRGIALAKETTPTPDPR